MMNLLLSMVFFFLFTRTYIQLLLEWIAFALLLFERLHGEDGASNMGFLFLPVCIDEALGVGFFFIFSVLLYIA